VVREVTLVLREWGNIWKRLFVVSIPELLKKFKIKMTNEPFPLSCQCSFCSVPLCSPLYFKSSLLSASITFWISCIYEWRFLYFKQRNCELKLILTQLVAFQNKFRPIRIIRLSSLFFSVFWGKWNIFFNCVHKEPVFQQSCPFTPLTI